MMSFDDFLPLKNGHIRRSKITRGIRTDLRTYGGTEGRTDTTSYRDAQSHLKSEEGEEEEDGF